jgi:imidazolonepropionase-like amidohydrolase
MVCLGQIVDIRSRSPLLLAGVLAAGCMYRAAPPQQAVAVDSSSIAFVDVSIVPMDSGRVIHHRTVIVRGGRIAEIGAADSIRPAVGSARVDGRGRYLMPGLADMHAHPDSQDLALYVANGVTTIRVMAGDTGVLRWREEIRAGRRVGPAIYTAGPILDGKPPTAPFMRPVGTAEDATKAVDEQRAAGYDFIKIYNLLSADAYRAIVDEARRLGVPVAGHVPISVGLRGALAAHQASIEHLRGYAAEAVRPDAPIKPSVDFRSRILAWNYADESRFAELARATRDAGVWNCPTLVTEQVGLLPHAEYRRWLESPEMRYVAPEYRVDGRDTAWGMKEFTEADYVAAQRAVSVKMHLVKALHDAGARLLVGTDEMVAGFSEHQELRNMVGAGLTPYEALRAATRDAAEFLGQVGEWGTVAVGRRGDLVLLDADPLADVANARRIVGIMVRGHWLSREALDRMLDRVAASFLSPPKP